MLRNIAIFKKNILNISLAIFFALSLLAGVFYYLGQKSDDSELAQYISHSQKIILPIINTTSSITMDPTAVRVPILVYHSVRTYFPGETPIQKKFDVDPDIFAAQLRYLKIHGYSAITFDDLVKKFDGAALPANPVIISFDDGWENQYEYAFPILEKENLKATFFIYSNAIGHRAFLKWDQVRELSNAGMTIGGHSKYHPYLWKITDPKRLSDEIISSKKITESQIGKTLTVFAYPFGRYSTSTIEMVKLGGYRSARSGYAGAYHTKKDLFTLHSIQVGNDIKNFAAALRMKK